MFDYILKFAGTVVTLSGFLFALWQYYKTQSQNRVRTAADLVEKFFSKESNKLALILIDWSEVRVNLPKDIQILTDETKILHHTQQKMKEAFSMDNREQDSDRGLLELKKALWSTDAPTYIEIFDMFFAELAKMEFYLASGLIRVPELRLLAFWLKKMNDATYQGCSIFGGYIQYYYPDDVARLMERLKIFPKTASESQRTQKLLRWKLRLISR